MKTKRKSKSITTAGTIASRFMILHQCGLSPDPIAGRLIARRGGKIAPIENKTAIITPP